MRALKELDFVELTSGPAVLERGAPKLLREVGVIEFLDSYIINIPTSAAFISGFETSRAQDSIEYVHADNENEAVPRFESRMLVWASNVQLLTWAERSPDALHGAFFEALEVDPPRGGRGCLDSSDHQQPLSRRQASISVRH